MVKGRTGFLKQCKDSGFTRWPWAVTLLFCDCCSGWGWNTSGNVSCGCRRGTKLQEALAVLLQVQVCDLQDAHSCGVSFVLHYRLPEASGKE